MESYHSAVL